MAPAQAHRNYLATRTFGSLDGVRGLCILAVLWHHTGSESQWPIFQRGFLGVDMFFVLSGFLIVTLLLRERDRTGGISLKKFYARRTLRIFPIYYLLIFSVLFLQVALKPGSRSTQEYLAAFPFLVLYLSNWVLLPGNNFGILWSLATEEQFYLGWPMIEKLFRPVGVAVMLAAVLVVNQLINFGVLDPLFEWIYGRHVQSSLLDATYTPIALGVLLAHLLHGPRTYSSLCRLLGHRGSSLGLLALMLALAAFWPGDLSGPGRLSIQVSMMLALGALVVREDHWCQPLMKFAPLAFLGIISYGVYLYHMWAIHPLRLGFVRLGWGARGTAFFCASLVVSAVVAGLSFRFIELPLLRLKSRFSAEGAEPAPGAQPLSQFAEAPA
jgi:peptidoglycan/LPS O-acetylase OafA/YrhL